MIRAPIYATQALILSTSLLSIARFFKFRTARGLFNTPIKEVTGAKGLEYARVCVLNHIAKDPASIVMNFLKPKFWDFSEKIVIDYFFDTTLPDVVRNHAGVVSLEQVVQGPLDSILAVPVDEVIRRHFIQLRMSIAHHGHSIPHDQASEFLRLNDLHRNDLIELLKPEIRDNVAIVQQTITNLPQFKSLLGKLLIRASAKLYVFDKAVKAGGYYMTSANVSEAVTKFIEDFGKIDENGFIFPPMQNAFCGVFTSETYKTVCVESSNFLFATIKGVDSLAYNLHTLERYVGDQIAELERNAIGESPKQVSDEL